MKNERKLAVITGAASGIGLALVKECIAQAMDVVMVDNADHILAEQVSQVKKSAVTEVIGFTCDVAQVSEVQQLAQQVFHQFERVDLLINNAGISGQLAPIWQMPLEQVHRVLDVNLYGVIHGVQAFLPRMLQQQGRSQLVNMASVYGLCSGSQMSAYAMSKHAVVALSESLYFDLQRMALPVDVSVVCPSFVDTRLLVNSKPSEANKLHDLLTSMVSHSRSAEAVAAAIMREIIQKKFYILPDKEVKNYCEARVEAIVAQNPPSEHSLEKVIAALSLRAEQSK